MASTRRLAAILAADVVGYSRLMGADEEGTHERVTACLTGIVDPKIAQYRGRIVKSTGDGFLAEFASVVDAVRSAVEVQREMAAQNIGIATDQRIAFRIGINLGDIIADGDDIFGDGVNVAARLEALAAPGGICISRVVRDQIRDKLPYPFEDMGDQSVKNITRPVRVYAWRPEGVADLSTTSVPIAVPTRHRRSILAPIGAAFVAVLVIAVVTWWFWPTTRSSPTATPAVAATTSIAQPLVAPRLSIVVLPFANLNNDPEQQYFADAVTEDLTTNLSRISGSFVISRNTAFTYKDKPVNAKQIGRELGVRYVLEGSVRRLGNQVRISVQLIDAASDAHLWAEQLDSDTGDLFALQNEITGRIGNALSLELIGAEAARPTADPDALDYILRGRAARAKGPAGNTEAIALFERALALDPRSVEAEGQLANALMSRVGDVNAETAAADTARAEGLIDQVLAASPRNRLAHFAKGQVLRAQRRCQEATLEYETVLALDRNSASALINIGRCRMLTGSLDEAIPPMEQAIRLSPRDPFIDSWYSSIGRVHLLQSRIDEAILWFEKSRSANPGFAYPHSWLASTYALKGDLDRAATELAEARRLVSDDRYSSIARLRAVGYWGIPKISALFEATYFAGLRKAGVPEE
jgi:adenylate cyclase